MHKIPRTAKKHFAMIKTVIAISLIISAASCSSVNELGDKPNILQPRPANLYILQRNINGPTELQRNVSDELMVRANYPKNVYDEKSFLPLAITDDTTNDFFPITHETQQNKLQIEKRVRGILKKFNIEDGGLVSKTLTTFLLALLMLLIYNGFYLKLY